MQELRVKIPKDSPMKPWADKWINEQRVKEKCSQEDFDEIYQMFNAKEDIQYPEDWSESPKVFVGMYNGNTYFLLSRSRQKYRQKLPKGAVVADDYHPLNVEGFPFSMHNIERYSSIMQEMKFTSSIYRSEKEANKEHALKFAEELKQRTIIDYFIDDENGLMFRMKKEDFTDNAEVDLQIFEGLLSNGLLKA